MTIFIPEANELPVVSPSVPAFIFSAVPLPIVFPVIVIDAATPDEVIPKTPPATAAVVPLLLKLPITLF